MLKYFRRTSTLRKIFNTKIFHTKISYNENFPIYGISLQHTQCVLLKYTHTYAFPLCTYMYIPVYGYAGHRLKILWGKSQASVPAPGTRGGNELAPVPGLPEGQ